MKGAAVSREPKTTAELTALRILAEPHMYSPGAVVWASTIIAVVHHDLHSYATDRATGLTSVTCSCGWQSLPAETIPNGIDLWTAHVNNAYAPEPVDV